MNKYERSWILRSGFSEYRAYDTLTFTDVYWFVPNELVGNKIVISRMVLKPFIEILNYIDQIGMYKSRLNRLYLDIEKKSIRPKIEEFKVKIINLLDEANKDLFPYHWSMRKENNEYIMMLSDDKPDYFRKLVLEL